MVAACYFWPGSEAPIGGVRPTMWRTYDAGIGQAERVRTVVEWLRRAQRGWVNAYDEHELLAEPEQPTSGASRRAIFERQRRAVHRAESG